MTLGGTGADGGTLPRLCEDVQMRDLSALPKTHLHLHFTGSMSVRTLEWLAAAQGVDLPDSLVDAHPLSVPYDKRGWYRFQRLYDAARAVVRSEEAIRHVVRQAAFDDAREGSRRLELQVDPSSYAPFVGGLTSALEIILDEAKTASVDSGVQVAVIVAASRLRHPLDARTLARLAARYAGEGAGEVVGFGLSNDERHGDTALWEGAFRIARKAGLAGVPHGGELLGPDHIAQVITELHPTRLGHGIRAAERPALLSHIVERGIALEACPTSNVQLGVFPTTLQVPLRQLYDSGAIIAFSADDPLLFLSRLVDQYEIARSVHGFNDAELANLATASVDASLASSADKQRWRSEIRDWLAEAPG